jgi:hypothetical protein
VVDLHSISVPYEPDAFRTRCLDLTAMLFATGLDPARSTIFVQSQVPAHAEAKLLAPIKRRYLELRGDDAELARLLASGAEKARAVSAPTLSRMYDRMGFVPRVRD